MSDSKMLSKTRILKLTKVRQKPNRLYHIMFLPLFGEMDSGFVLNLITIVVFFGIYLWHTKHDHKHNEELLDEVKKIREKLQEFRKS